MTKRCADVMLSTNSIETFIQKLKKSSYWPIRDFIRDKIPNDIDIIKPCHDTAKFQQWIDEISSLGYTFSENDLEEQMYTGTNLVTLHIIEEDDPVENTRLSPCCDPDYDVNFLAMDKNGIFNWVDLSDVMPIITSIQRNETKSYQPDPVRKEKMKIKGFKILIDEYKCNESLSTGQTEFMAVSEQITESKRKIEELNKQIKDVNRKTEDINRKTEDLNKKTEDFKKQIRESHS